MVPSLPERACPDFTGLKNPFTGWPENFSAPDKDYWENHKRFTMYCRAKELMRREETNPGSQSAGQVEYAWMALESIHDFSDKVSAIYDANKFYGVPPQVLTGALYQESVLMRLGIALDGGNYSCGIGQVNIQEWCHWANEQSAEKKLAMAWPEGVTCNSEEIANPTFVAPFYEIAKSRLNGQPEYRLLKEHFANISYADVKDGFPAASEELQSLRYQATRSFIDNCSDVRNGILAKANELALLYNTFVPTALKNKDRYSEGDKFQRSCKQNPTDNAYPLHTGWLIAVAAYNAGPGSFAALSYYNHWDRSRVEDPATWEGFYADQMIESFYWAGRYNESTGQLDYLGLDGEQRSWAWWKACVAQRHIARVIQNVQLNSNFFVETLEDEYTCQRSGVPEFRRNSSGVK